MLEHFAHAGFFFFLFPTIGLFLAGITGWRQLDLQGGLFDFLGNKGKQVQYHTKDTNIKKKNWNKSHSLKN